MSGSADVYVGDLMKGFTAKSPQQAFRSEMWKDIVDIYIGKGAKRGFWRLIVAAQSTEHAAETPVKEAV